MTAEQAISWLTLKPKDLPVFVLVATDPLAERTVYAWTQAALKADVPMNKIMGAMKVEADFKKWPVKILPG